MIQNLAYIGIETPRLADWRDFAPTVLGAEVAESHENSTLRLRVDDYPWRLAIHQADADDLAYLGWAVDDLDRTIAALTEAGIETGVEDGVARFTDPFGFRHDLLVSGAAGKPFSPAWPTSGFVTGEQGLGHVVLIVPDISAAEDLYVRTMGLVPSDTIEAGITIRFYHCRGTAARHHTLALSEAPGLAGFHHLMLEVRTLDDVGRALDRALDHGVPISMSLGRHTNDGMTSFYVRTPSGFDIEYGTGGVTIDDRNWTPARYDAMSLWGHRTPNGQPVPPAILRPVS